MTSISPEDRNEIVRRFESLKEPVTILFHKPEGKENDFSDFLSALEDICSMSELLSTMDMVEMETDEDLIHDVDMFPALVLLDGNGDHHGIRFYGIPSGKLFEVFIDTIVMISSGEDGLEKGAKERVMALDENKLLILCTPGVPGLGPFLMNCMRMAFVSERIECGVADLIQFPELAEEYHVLDMPKTISNSQLRFSGIYSLDETLEILEKRIGDAED
ncbi:MAG TPA: hypothetical protein ENK47_05565 [Euryarchaeota archaeon]|nr:hypothetical protein [Euryarchaeota archaeon]